MRYLILGGTGAIGRNLVNLATKTGNEVFVTTRQKLSSNNTNLTYIQGDAKDRSFLEDLLKKKWDVIIDFMVWSTRDFESRVGQFLNSTDQYVFISSYRVYADSKVITEDSPRLLDVSRDKDFLSTDEYALSKARCEDLLFSNINNNWTILRPSIVYDSSGRFDMGVLSMHVWLWRAVNNIPIPFPCEMLAKRTTLTAGVDVARMIMGIIGNSSALGEVYTASTSENLSWGDVVDIYQYASRLTLIPCSLQEFVSAKGSVYQIKYDRMLDRVIDNSKILNAANLSQQDLIKTKQGLGKCVSDFLLSGEQIAPWPGDNGRLDGLIGGIPSFRPILTSKLGIGGAIKYLIRRIGSRI